LRDASNFKNFLENTKKSEKVKSLSENQWITYMFIDAPWPMANFDCVQKYTFSKIDNGFTLKGIVDANAYKAGDVERMEVYTIEYRFEKVNDTSNKLTLTANFKPTVSVPKFLLSGWFPNGPTKLLTGLLEGAAKI